MSDFSLVLSYIDRANIGNAKIEGIEADLGLTPKQYQIVLSIFFIGYILCGAHILVSVIKAHKAGALTRSQRSHQTG